MNPNPAQTLRDGKVLLAFAHLHDVAAGFNPRLPWYGFIADLNTVEEARRRAWQDREIHGIDFQRAPVNKTINPSVRRKIERLLRAVHPDA
jgi:hypothetical protein